MPDIEPLRFPSREGRDSQQDQRDIQTVCSGRRHRCILLNSPLPCVNKAVFHLQELKVQVENWCQQIEQDKHQDSKTSRFQHVDSDTDSLLYPDLYIEGIGLGPRENSPMSPVWRKITDVLGEVVGLMERLEADRQDAEESLQKEKTRRRFLQSRLDNISQWKQQEHSVVVQKEHDACDRAIAELKWHLNLERDKLDHDQENLCHIEVLNRRIHDDMDFIQKQAPLLIEKLEFQQCVIDEINTAQAEADKVYAKTCDELQVAQRELERMELDVNAEKARLEHELQNVKDQRDHRLEELKQLQMLEDDLNVERQNAEQFFHLKAKECAALSQSITERKELEKATQQQIYELRAEIESEMQPTEILKERISALQEDIQRTKVCGDGEVSRFEAELRSKRDSLMALREENMEYQVKVEDHRKQISKSEKSVTQMQEHRKQMLQRISENEQRWEGAKEEVTCVVAQHSVIKARLERQEQLSFMEEQRTREVIEKLRRELTNQTAALGRLRARCTKITEELHQHQESSEETNEKLRREFCQASSATNVLEIKMQEIKTLREKLEGILHQNRKSLIQSEKEKKRQLEQLEAVKGVYASTVRRYDHTTARISDLEQKTIENREASVKMEETALATSDSLAERKGVFDVAEFRNKSAALVMSTLQSDINNCLRRAQRSMQTHTAHVTARRRKMEDVKEALTVALRENAALASEYEDLQRVSVRAKQEVTLALFVKNGTHESFLYYTKLSLLQKRMHKALVKHFKQHSLYSRAELDRCQALSQETDRKIKTAQEELASEILQITSFLKSITDNSITAEGTGVNKDSIGFKK